VHGKENIPSDDRICFVSNHQEYTDILLLLGWLGKNVGFVGKQQLEAIPILSTWMMLLHSLFLDGKSLRQGLGVMHRGARNIKHGYAMVIFAV
jgi:1-acyl-sn-glycerol-3-phosphate acyltransferase